MRSADRSAEPIENTEKRKPPVKIVENGLFQKKSAPPQRMGFWKFSREGGSKTLEIQAGGGVKLGKVFCRGHFDR